MRADRGVLFVLCVAFLIVPTGGESATRSVTAIRAAAPVTSRERQNGDWIAYSTVPGNDQGPSDIFLVREGGTPRLVAGRRDGKTWNVCPAFSPDGTMLAFGTKSPRGRAVSVVGVTRTGTIVAQRISLKVAGRGPGPCPLWASDGSRLAYISGRRVIVRGLGGSSPPAARGDPVSADFRVSTDGLRSPRGDLIARRTDNGVVVARPDGSDRRVLMDSLGLYAVAAWSPDGRKIIVMQDISGLHFTMLAVSVDAPFTIVPIVERVRVNHGRSWPGRGDVSWQPRIS